MWTGPYGVAFSPPEDLQDWTRYAFTEPSGREFVNVDYGSVPLSAATALDVMSQRARELDSLKYFYPDAVVEPVLEMPIGARKGAMVSYTAYEQHYQFREWWAIALLDRGTFVQIVYYGPALDPTSTTRLRRILASVGPWDEVLPKPSPPRFIRYDAGRIALDVPESLTPPSSYSFTSPDLKLALDFAIFPQPTLWTPPTGEVGKRSFETVTVDRIHSVIQSFAATDIGAGQPEPRQYMHGEIHFDDEVTVHVDGRAPAELSDKLNEAFRVLFQSVQRKD